MSGGTLEPFAHLHDPVDPNLSAVAFRAFPASTCTLLAARVALRVLPIMAHALLRLTQRVNIDVSFPRRCEIILRSLLEDPTRQVEELQPLLAELARLAHITEDTRSGPRGFSIPRDASPQSKMELSWSGQAVHYSCRVIEHALQTSRLAAPHFTELAPADHVHGAIFYAVHAEACQLILLGRRFDESSHMSLATTFDAELAATEANALRSLSIWPTEQPDWA